MVLNHGSIVKTLGGKGILRKKCIFLPQKWPKWPKMAKEIPSFSLFVFFTFFSLIALYVTFLGGGRVENTPNG